ncbi:MAG: sugar phosphate isomerase/epimerase [Armatimonadota bacterium]|nr:sugar phosphate isomerase/epimerase [Armatimonadota bacterium]MCX7777475.1 sugar phosphate isomerase/epimerase [Armatimonadota bacterium]MDW8025516.1 sugar phosphate isomerase/epimerase [Armatimonadota bacterium]
MKVGIVAFPNEIESYITWACINGFEHIEIDLYSEPQRLERFHGWRIRCLQNLLCQTNMSVSLHAPYTLNLAEPLPYLRTCVFKYVERLMWLADSIGALWVCVHPGYAIGIPSLVHLRAEALERSYDSIEHLLKLCERYGVTLALENLNPIPLDGELIFLCDNLLEMQRTLERFNTPRLRMVLDAGHANTAEGVVEYVHKLHQFIVGIHVHDNDGAHDSHSLPGDGTLPWDEFISALKLVGFSGPLNVELFDDKHKLEAKSFIERLLQKHGIRRGEAA